MLEWSHAEWDRASRWGSVGVAAVAAVACLWWLVRLSWLVLGGVGAGSVASAPMPLANAPAAPTVSVSKWHLFGSAAVVRAEVRNAPATQLRLLLKGTVAEGDPLAGMAVIADESGTERAYRSGESVPGGATLQEIYPDRVILQHEGVSETLNLPDQGVAAASAPAVASGPPPRGLAGISGAPAPAGGALPNNVLFVPPPPTGQVDYSKLQQQFGVDPASLARQVTALPVMVNGKMTGVRLSGGPEALMSKLGLKADDVVTAVNGIPLDSPARLPQLQDSLKSAAQITATVLRDGKPTTLSVTVK